MGNTIYTPEKRIISRYVDRLEKEVQKYKFDPVTGLKGRRDFNNRFGRLFRMTEKQQGKEETADKFVAVLIDVDNLHQINRQSGYQSGDDTLFRIGRELSLVCRRTQAIATPYRIGGDEFAITIRAMAGKSWTQKQLEDALCSIEGITFVILEYDQSFQSPQAMFNRLDRLLTNKKNALHLFYTPPS